MQKEYTTKELKDAGMSAGMIKLLYPTGTKTVKITKFRIFTSTYDPRFCLPILARNSEKASKFKRLFIKNKVNIPGFLELLDKEIENYNWETSPEYQSVDPHVDILTYTELIEKAFEAYTKRTKVL